MGGHPHNPRWDYSLTLSVLPCATVRIDQFYELGLQPLDTDIRTPLASLKRRNASLEINHLEAIGIHRFAGVALTAQATPPDTERSRSLTHQW